MFCFSVIKQKKKKTFFFFLSEDLYSFIVNFRDKYKKIIQIFRTGKSTSLCIHNPKQTGSNCSLKAGNTGKKKRKN